MHQIPRQIQAALREELDRRGRKQAEVRKHLKWCRFFIDFCLKSENSPRTSDSIPFFLKKIASKGQGPRMQTEAKEAVKILQEILPRFATGSETAIEPSKSKPKEGSRHPVVAHSKEVTAKMSIKNKPCY